MKQTIVVITCCMLGGLLRAQDETLFGNVDRSGAFGGPLWEYHNLDQDFQVASGGGGALILDDFYLGGYGMGDAEFVVEDAAANLRQRVKFKHGGLWLGYTPLQNKVLHPYASVKFGWGKARYLATPLDQPSMELEASKDNIFVMTPELGFELNVFSWFRVAVTGSYRLVSGADTLPVFNDDDLSEFAMQLTLRFGGFGREHKRHNDWD